MYEPSPVSSHQKEHALQSSPMNIAQTGPDLQASTGLHSVPSNHISGTPNQLGRYALVSPQDRQPHHDFNNAAIERPILDLGGQGLVNTGAGYDSTPKDPLSGAHYIPNSNDYVGPGQLHCIAGYGLQCYCVSCTASAKDFPIIPFQPNPAPSVSANSFNSVQAYDSHPRLNVGRHNLGTVGSYSNNPETYSNTGNNGSYPAQSSYDSMPVPHRDSAVSFALSSNLSGQAFSSIGLPGGDRWYPTDIDDMRAPPPNSSQRLPTPRNGRRKHYPQSKDRVQRRQASPRQETVMPSNAGTIASIECDTFLKAQEILAMTLKHGKSLSDIQKAGLTNLLGISTAELEFCLEAKRVLEPILNNLGSKAQTYGLPKDYVVRWFGQIQTHTPEKSPLRDSAYQSLAPRRQSLEPPKKRRKRSRDPSQQRDFQCTHIDHSGRHCLQESSNFTDWKRHEETHWPQRRWECLIEGTFPNITCSICGGYIDPDFQQFRRTHAGCFNQRPRKGHVFPRKDKLVPHVRIEHGCEPNLDAWHYPIPSNWRPQCGFCGRESFSDWDDRCDHVGKHFSAEGKRMVPDWRDPWPVEQAADAPDESNDDDDNDDNHNDDDEYDGDDNDDDGDGADHNDSPSDRDADGENDPDHTTGSGSRQNSSNRGGNESHTPGRRSSNHDHGVSRTYTKDGGIHSSPHRGRQAQIWGPETSTPQGHQNLSIRGSPLKIRGPGGDDDFFKSVGQLGYGTFGFVDEVEHTATKIHFARKTIRVVQHKSFSAILQAQREVAALRSLKHVHIVDLAASYTFEDQFSIIMAPVAEYNLSEYILYDSSPTSIRISNLARWIGCLASAVSYMHDKSYQHLDIKPSNILIADDQVMLSDFGGAVILNGLESSNLLSKGCAVTPMYCAPEIADRRGASFVAGASDVYSLGCVFLELATVIHRESLPDFEQFRAFGSSDPTYHRNHQKSLIWIDYLSSIDGNLGLALQDEFSIIRNMINHDWTKRPSARGIEDSFHLWHLQSKSESEKKNYLIIAQAEASFNSLAVVRLWLQNCLNSHTSCKSTKRAFFPSRILNVGIDGDTIRLESSDPSSPYVALSYCWGTTTSLKTTSQTLGRMFKSIPVSSLSNTFSNAVRITRALGFHYLWIDALCIVQDSHEDWTTQVAQMSKIYSHSTLTICAASETQPPHTNKHKILDTTQKIGGSRSPCSTCDTGYRAFKPLVEDTPTTMLLDSPWSKRGWTFQERILSPRILYYSSNRIAWECDGERSTLDRVSRIRDSLKLLGIGKHSLPNKQEADPTFPLMRSFRKTWRDIVREFSKRHLTVATDKLPAVAGVAYEMAAMSRQSYVAGLWKGDLINDLLWCRDFPTIPLPRPTYRAPSWSWAAIDSPVVWSKAMECPVEKNARVLDCQTKVLSELAPFAGVSNGYLWIKGLSRKVVVTYSRPEAVLDRKSLHRIAFAQWDTLDVQKTTSTDPRLKCHPVEELLCLQILSEAGLLLREVTDGDLQTFQRVGVYWNQTDDDPEQAFDESWKICSIKII
ncbi:hypothetical protein EG329_014449 [Mollisiaceae sp. DMI_Dod_QoI]|nr:hypothetical protein EG329_014449 [Helotiales sp. DMI_Dod_QoI]